MGRWANGPPGNATEVAGLRKELADLKSKLQEAGKPEEASPGQTEQDDPGAKCNKLLAQIATLTGVLGCDHPEVAQRQRELEEIRSQRPLGSRLLASQKKIAKLEKRQEQKLKDIEDIKVQQTTMAKQLVDLEGEHTALAQELETLKEQQAQLVVESPGGSGPAVAGHPGMAATKATLEGMAGTPGIDAQSAAAVHAVLGLLSQQKRPAPAATPVPGPASKEGVAPTQLDKEDVEMDEGLDEAELLALAGDSKQPGFGSLDEATRKSLVRSIHNTLVAKRRKTCG